MAQIRGVLRKMITHYPPGRRILARNHVFTTTFCVCNVTKVCGYRPFGYFLRPFHLLIKLYPLIPFPSSVDQSCSDYTRTLLRSDAPDARSPWLVRRGSTVLGSASGDARRIRKGSGRAPVWFCVVNVIGSDRKVYCTRTVRYSKA